MGKIKRFIFSLKTPIIFMLIIFAYYTVWQLLTGVEPCYSSARSYADTLLGFGFGSYFAHRWTKKDLYTKDEVRVIANKIALVCASMAKSFDYRDQRVNKESNEKDRLAEDIGFAINQIRVDTYISKRNKA